MAPEWTNKIPNYAICNFFYAFYVVYAVIVAFAVLQIVYILAGMKKFDLAHGIIVLTLFHYLVCDRALMDKAIEDVEGFVAAATTTQQAAAKKTSTTQTKAGAPAAPPAKAPVKCVPGCVP